VPFTDFPFSKCITTGMHEKPDKLDQYKAWMADHGKKSTAIRMQIAERAISFGQPFNADELLATFEPRGEISRPAVYRTLAEMALSSVLRRVEQDGRAVYVPK
jgi:Fe2+ or Zn2+ uptake regulation protein